MHAAEKREKYETVFLFSPRFISNPATPFNAPYFFTYLLAKEKKKNRKEEEEGKGFR